MNRYVLYVVLALLLSGCGRKEEAIVIAQQQVAKALWEQQQAEKNAAIALANQKAVEEKAALEKSSSERIIFGLSVGALLAFFIGIGLGSSSRKTAAAQAKVSSG
jgi:ABC-type nitrate/sulfonate/bicarbonate transport system permease component